MKIIILVLVLINLVAGKRILTSSYPPLVECTLGKIGKQTTDFSGIDIELIKKIVEKLGWEDAEWDFECVNFDVWQELVQDTSVYLGFAGALTVDYQQVTDDILFSLPYWTTGLSIITYKYFSTWQFLKILTPETIVCFIFSLFICGIVTFFLERRKHSMEQYIWNSFTNFFFLQMIPLKRMSSRIIQFFIWFMVFIVIQYWTAQVTASNSLYEMRTDLNSHYNLMGRRVKSSLNYREVVYSLGAKWVDTKYTSNNEYDSLPDNTISEPIVLRDLERDDGYKIDAYILDDSFAKIISTQNCKLILGHRLFNKFSYGIGFSVNQNSTLIQNVNYAIQQLIDQNFAESYLQSYISTSVTSCKKQDYEQIIPAQVAGIFMIQGIAVALGLVLWIFTLLPIYPKVRGLMEKYKIFEEQVEKPQLLGDDLSAQNLKETTQRIFKTVSDEISERLDEMDECVGVFYENLMTEEAKRKAFRIKEHIYEINNIIEKHERSLNGTKEQVGNLRQNSGNQSLNKIKNPNDSSANKLVPDDIDDDRSEEEDDQQQNDAFNRFNHRNSQASGGAGGNNLYGSNTSNNNANNLNNSRNGENRIFQQYKERQNSRLNLSGNKSVQSSNSFKGDNSPDKNKAGLNNSHQKQLRFGGDSPQKQQDLEQNDEDFELIENVNLNKNKKLGPIVPKRIPPLNNNANQQKQIIKFDDSDDSEESDAPPVFNKNQPKKQPQIPKDDSEDSEDSESSENESEEEEDKKSSDDSGILGDRKNNNNPNRNKNPRNNAEGIEMQESFGLKNVVVDNNLSGSDFD